MCRAEQVEVAQVGYQILPGQGWDLIQDIVLVIIRAQVEM
jgi:hypothetical protein